MVELCRGGCDDVDVDLVVERLLPSRHPRQHDDVAGAARARRREKDLELARLAQLIDRRLQARRHRECVAAAAPDKRDIDPPPDIAHADQRLRHNANQKLFIMRGCLGVDDATMAVAERQNKTPRRPTRRALNCERSLFSRFGETSIVRGSTNWETVNPQNAGTNNQRARRDGAGVGA